MSMSVGEMVQKITLCMHVAKGPKVAKRLKHNHFRSLISTKDTYLRVKKFQIILKDFISPKLSTSVIFNGHSHTNIMVIQFAFQQQLQLRLGDEIIT